ncbi:transcriptional regulator, MarR family protein [Pseudooceanicola batsensis HTCC2597]|uniref:Transcriptional regulator, MarR family protein n=1 Tax=Pseudooceanicola batsensis (strain ATCC BAA-863 / DSM 15984 / KCTC 12145 / HTCC2597) TaxID=252305 RepID=A3TVY4_PSEBH|nr:MarR family winged helix-turn-helix transcriptional regulator [Pseudooceanicola batsensis]EAQ03780.1 transcriptional regulator, MarR family protein [Pseudooceanicola batsensis HTCC2597]
MIDTRDAPETPALAELLSGSCYCLATRRASRRLVRLYDAALADHGLTISQLATLAWIRHLRKPTVQKIADLMEMDQSALSRGLMPLERAGLVTSQPDDMDKRKKVLALTEAGNSRLVAAAEDWSAAQREVEADQARRHADIARLISGINGLAVSGADDPQD